MVSLRFYVDLQAYSERDGTEEGDRRQMLEAEVVEEDEVRLNKRVEFVCRLTLYSDSPVALTNHACRRFSPLRLHTSFRYPFSSSSARQSIELLSLGSRSLCLPLYSSRRQPPLSLDWTSRCNSQKNFGTSRSRHSLPWQL